MTLKELTLDGVLSAFTLLSMVSSGHASSRLLANGGSVDIEVTDSFGQLIDHCEITLSSQTHQKRGQKRERSCQYSIGNLELGDYELKVQAPGFEPVIRSIHIDERDQFFRVSLQVYQGHSGKQSNVVGMVSTCGYTKLSVRLIPVYDSSVFDAKIHSDGKFKFFSVKPGVYTVLLMRTNEILQARRISVFNGDQHTVYFKCKKMK